MPGDCRSSVILVRSCAVWIDRLPRPGGGSHVGRHRPQFDPEELGDRHADAARSARGRRRRRRSRPRTALSPARRAAPCRRRWPAQARRNRDARLVRRERRHPGPRSRTRSVHEEDGHRRQDQHRRPRHLPGADQQLPAGQARRRLHVVRRLPDAVLRAEGPRDADRRRLEDADAADAAGLEGRLDRPRRAPVLRPDLQLPVGGLLPQERLRRRTATPSRRRGTSSSRSPRRCRRTG